MLGLIVGAVFAYCVAMLSSGAQDHAEITDDCNFPSFTTAQYRVLVYDAKKLVDPQWKMVSATPDASQLLTSLLGDFLKNSLSTEETFVRLYAFGRALSGRLDMRSGQSPMPHWAYWNSKGQALVDRQLAVTANFQVPNGTFSWDVATNIFAFLLGRRHEEFGATLRFKADGTNSHRAELVGSNLVEANAYRGLKVSLTTSIHWGDSRIANACPDYSRFERELGIVLSMEKQ